MKVIVCGGRNFGNISGVRTRPGWLQREKEYKFIFQTLTDLLLVEPTEENPMGYPEDMPVILSGGATGTDSVAIDWAAVNWLEFVEFPANWGLYGNRAGTLRNERMLQEAPDLVVAFPGGRGTAHMVKIAKAAGIEVKEYEYKLPEISQGAKS